MPLRALDPESRMGLWLQSPRLRSIQLTLYDGEECVKKVQDRLRHGELHFASELHSHLHARTIFEVDE